MNVKKITSFVALFDVHVGWEKVRSRGKESVVATHNLKAVKAVMRFVEDFKPEAVLLVGDQLNCGPISHWVKGQPRVTENFRLKDEMDMLDALILQPIDDVPIKMWFKGNHEMWIQNHIDAHPSVEGLVEPENYLDLRKRGYQIYEQGEVGSLGNLHFVHGDVAMKGGKDPAGKLMFKYRRNIRAGHLHTYAACVDVTPVDSRDYHTAILVPSLSTRNPAYAKNDSSNHLAGFLYGWVWPGGKFWDQVVIINDGAFMYNGQIYHGS